MNECMQGDERISNCDEKTVFEFYHDKSKRFQQVFNILVEAALFFFFTMVN